MSDILGTHLKQLTLKQRSSKLCPLHIQRALLWGCLYEVLPPRCIRPEQCVRDYSLGFDIRASGLADVKKKANKMPSCDAKGGLDELDGTFF